MAKPEAANLLRRELRKPGYQAGPLALGSNTDPYQPVERDLRITRQILEVLREARHPTAIVTKSALILRDLDIIAEMAGDGLAQVMLSVTTLRRDLARAMEPRAASPARRLSTLAALKEAGVPVGVLASPMIPALNDSELEAILEAAAEAGAGSAGFILVRLPHELKELFSEWLETHVPTRAAHVESLIRDTRGRATLRGEVRRAHAGGRGLTRNSSQPGSGWPRAASASTGNIRRSAWTSSVPRGRPALPVRCLTSFPSRRRRPYEHPEKSFAATRRRSRASCRGRWSCGPPPRPGRKPTGPGIWACPSRALRVR